MVKHEWRNAFFLIVAIKLVALAVLLGCSGEDTPLGVEPAPKPTTNDLLVMFDLFYEGFQDSTTSTPRTTVAPSFWGETCNRTDDGIDCIYDWNFCEETSYGVLCGQHAIGFNWEACHRTAEGVSCLRRAAREAATDTTSTDTLVIPPLEELLDGLNEQLSDDTSDDTSTSPTQEPMDTYVEPVVEQPVVEQPVVEPQHYCDSVDFGFDLSGGSRTFRMREGDFLVLPMCIPAEFYGQAYPVTFSTPNMLDPAVVELKSGGYIDSVDDDEVNQDIHFSVIASIPGYADDMCHITIEEDDR